MAKPQADKVLVVLYIVNTEMLFHKLRKAEPCTDIYLFCQTFPVVAVAHQRLYASEVQSQAMSQKLVGIAAGHITESIVGLCIHGIGIYGTRLANNLGRHLLLAVFPDVQPFAYVVHDGIVGLQAFHSEVLPVGQYQFVGQVFLFRHQSPDVDLRVFLEGFHLAFQTYQRDIDALMVFHAFTTCLYGLDGFQQGVKRFLLVVIVEASQFREGGYHAIVRTLLLDVFLDSFCQFHMRYHQVGIVCVYPSVNTLHMGTSLTLQIVYKVETITEVVEQHKAYGVSVQRCCSHTFRLLVLFHMTLQVLYISERFFIHISTECLLRCCLLH